MRSPTIRPDRGASAVACGSASRFEARFATAARWAFFAVALLVIGCEGPSGPQGEPGEAGAAGATGAQGPIGMTGPPGSAAPVVEAGASIPVGCLSPCHGFNGVVAQFKTSVHYVVYVQNLGSATATEWTTTGGACGNCHAIDALEQRAKGHVLTSDDAGVVHLAGGDLQYAAPDGALSTANYAGVAAVAEVYCTTCHAVTNANDPHLTGVAWTPGSFPFYVAADAGGVFVEKSPSTAAVTGTSAGSFGASDTCMWCHRSRVDVTHYLAPTGNVITSVHWGPHEGPQADLFTGIGGYQYAGQVYGQSTHEKMLSCVDCHMIDMANNGNVADHSFNANLLACAGCHATATTFDVNGFQSQVQGALTQIETWLNTQGVLTRSTDAPPFTPLTADQIGDGNWALDGPVPGATIAGALLTQDQAGALYNYILVARGGAFGVHNPKYIAQLLYDSYFALTGLPLAVFPQRPQ